eukprot:CAMPEP_0174981616 /NCGR_PEP_ID=MMETSP0004_2-20121128/15995_1 /TAXON_ID=420556 /ORGANISM="Ochromonas sp., Strain CCMP1393" /LENGTH=98 /DNA_ID=CAMNT_0016233393 /DNA_START=334 /DNA_END=630 /DNA_ORIENTATION=-
MGFMAGSAAGKAAGSGQGDAPLAGLPDSTNGLSSLPLINSSTGSSVIEGAASSTSTTLESAAEVLVEGNTPALDPEVAAKAISEAFLSLVHFNVIIVK